MAIARYDLSPEGELTVNNPDVLEGGIATQT
jgi:hypothetical protein